MATFVLVHGAWHGGWCWQKVIPFLEPKEKMLQSKEPETVWWTPLSRPKNCIPSVQYRVWIQFHIPTPSGPPCPRRSCSHRRPFTGAEGLRCEQERLFRIANAASAPVHLPGRPALQRLVRSFLVVEP